MSVSVRLAEGPFDPAAELSALTARAEGAGGVVSFTGLVRRDADVLALELEAYPGFTEAAIDREAHEVRDRHALHDLHVVHRTGRIAPGEPVVFVAAAAAHRRSAFEGCDRMMDFLKSRAPFWKKEHTASGARWIEPRPQDYEDAARWDARAHPSAEIPR